MISSNYFDYAAATPLDPKVLAAMVPYFGDNFYNPSSEYLAAKQIAKDIKQARQRLSECLGVRSSEIIFTAGGTEANNLAINGVMELYPDAEIIVSSIEHDSVLVPASNYECKLAQVDTAGYLDLEQLENLISDNTALISVMYANNEIGTVQPLKQVADLVNEVKKHRAKTGNKTPLIFHSDASQAGNYLSLKASAVGIDMMTVNGGKIYGPKQSGALFVSAGIRLSPQILGGGQENSMRSGTENVAGIIGLSHSVEIAQDLRANELKRTQKLQEKFIKNLQSKLPEAVVNGGSKRLPNNIHITVPGIDNERVMMQLDEAGFQVAVGSACSASSDQPSHVLKAIGLSDEAASSSLRFTMGRFTTPEAVDNLVVMLAAVCIDYRQKL